MTKRELGEPKNVLFRIKRGLSGYVSYLAACEMNESFSEYVLYEPILRILTARGYSVQCEVECPGVEHRETGDRKRLDFVAKKDSAHFALEVKWAKSRSLNVENDYDKLAGFLTSGGSTGRRAFLCVFGTERYIGDDLTLKPDKFTKVGKVWIAQFAVTRYGCRIYETKSPTKAKN